MLLQPPPLTHPLPPLLSSSSTQSVSCPRPLSFLLTHPVTPFERRGRQGRGWLNKLNVVLLWKAENVSTHAHTYTWIYKGFSKPLNTSIGPVKTARPVNCNTAKNDYNQYKIYTLPSHFYCQHIRKCVLYIVNNIELC